MLNQDYLQPNSQDSESTPLLYVAQDGPTSVATAEKDDLAVEKQWTSYFCEAERMSQTELTSHFEEAKTDPQEEENTVEEVQSLNLEVKRLFCHHKNIVRMIQRKKKFNYNSSHRIRSNNNNNNRSILD